MKYCPACHKTYPTDYESCPADRTRLAVTQEFQPGMIIRNKYEILERIGIGGMGTVYKARHLTFDELSAIKIISADLAADESFLIRFQTEAIIMRKLCHRNAVKVEDFDRTEDGRPFIVMELVEGRDLREVIQQDGPLVAPRAIRIARQIAEPIAVAHHLGIVHRDLKPQNVILTTDEDGQEAAKVLDFGVAKLRESAEQVRAAMTMTGMTVGTPLYMSPEQYLGKKARGEIDGRSDLYSLGIVLYQMVTGQLPFDADTPYSLMKQHLEATPIPPNELKPELHIPEPLSFLILKAIEKKREDRFQTAQEFIAALDRITPPSEPDSTAPALASVQKSFSQSKQKRLERASGWKLGLYMVAACILALLASSVGYMTYQSRHRQQIQSGISIMLRSAPSPTLQQAGVRVAVSGEGDVTLSGTVVSMEDSALAVSLASSAKGVKYVHSNLTIGGQDALLKRGMDFLDAGDYAAAIRCFQAAMNANPGDKRGSDLLERAQRAQHTEDQLLKSRR